MNYKYKVKVREILYFTLSSISTLTLVIFTAFLFFLLQRKSNGDQVATQQQQQQCVDDMVGGVTRAGEQRGCGGEGEAAAARVAVAGEGREVARKKYKSVTYTSCPARIAIKDIVK